MVLCLPPPPVGTTAAPRPSPVPRAPLGLFPAIPQNLALPAAFPWRTASAQRPLLPSAE